MDTQRTCSICGKPIAANAPEGLCPECLMKAALGTGATPGPGTESNPARPTFNPPAISELTGKFPQLEILEFIGRGGMGAVYKARQKELNRIVALKILPPQAASGPGFAERFAREARALAKLNHPHIVTLYEFGQADGLFYFLMEYVDGVNLRQLLQTGRIAPKEALAIVPQICEALQFAHDEGIVHRDIKPENILLDKKGQVKIADFGVAKIVAEGLTESASTAPPPSGELTAAGSALGTPQYMAPEQIKNSAEVDHRADIYSLGVVFYQMLTGELPAGKIEPPSKKVTVDVRLDEIVLRALEKKPELRYQQASVLKTEVETIAVSPAAPATGAPTPLFPTSFGLAFRSRAALNVARAGWILGCLGALGFLGSVPGWGRLKALFGFLGFFGLIGAAVVMEFIDRSQHRPNGEVHDTAVEGDSGRRFSRLAISGGISFLLAASAFGAVLFTEFQSFRFLQEMQGDLNGLDPAILMERFGRARSYHHFSEALAIGFAVIATILGWISIRQIHRCSGRLSGLWLAVLDGLFVPLLALAAFISFPIADSILASRTQTPVLLTLGGFTNRIGFELGHIPARFDSLQISALSNDSFTVSFSGLQELSGAGNDSRNLTGSLAAHRTEGDKWQFRGNEDLGNLNFDMVVANLDRLLASARIISVTAIAARKGDINVNILAFGQVESSNTVSFAIAQDYVQQVVGKFDAGHKFVVEAFDRLNQKQFGRGTLIGVDNQIDLNTGTLKCKANLVPENGQLMIPGLFLNIRLLLETKHNVTLVPNAAIQRDPQSAYVWVINSDRKVTRRRVNTGVIEDDVMEIQDGLAPGEMIVTDQFNRLQEGSAVSIHPASSP